MMPLTPEALQQMVEQNHEQAEEGHARLRTDYRNLSAKVDLNTGELSKLREKVVEIVGGERTTDINKLRFSPSVVGAVVLVVGSILGGVYGITSSQRTTSDATASDVRDILTRMASQKETTDARVKMQDERDTAIKTEVEEVKRRQEMWKNDMQSQLREILSKIEGRR